MGELLGETGEVCQPGRGCRKWPVHCLTTKLSWLSGSKAHRAQAVASAWGGSVEHVSMRSTLTHSEIGSLIGQRHGSVVVVTPCEGISAWQTQLLGPWQMFHSPIPQRSLLGRSGRSSVLSPCF